MLKMNQEQLAELRASVMAQMSPKRFRHTAAVEEEIARLSELFCPEWTDLLRVAGLLHDITKEKSAEEQILLCGELGIELTELDLLAPKTLHARTAEKVIERDYPEYADPIVLSAVRWHTTGHCGMTLPERLLYLADYIDGSRTFPSCVILRRYFWGARPEEMGETERLALLRDTLILSYQMTVKDLISDGRPVAPDTINAYNELLLEKNKG